ncbi:MAG: hypothetical protein Q7R52_00945 [archaeon]|nr:hypothetical protein [archaeon]
MQIGVTIFILIVVISAIWVIIEAKRMKHKVFAIFLIALIIFFYASAFFVFRGKDVDFKTVPGVVSATKVYCSWLTTVFYGNLKSMTVNAVHMNWDLKNSSISK